MLEEMRTEGHEQVVFCSDPKTGLRSIIAIHDTTLGPSLGGVRMHPYDSEEEALRDCLRLAKGMTYKAAAAGVNLGGGKSVIIGDPDCEKSEALLRAHGRFIQTLGGRYIPGIDVGTEMADLEVIAVEAERVSCIEGDPSPMTALGVFSGLQTAARMALGADSLSGLRVAVQGAGHVGSALVRLLVGDGASVMVSDVRQDRVQELVQELGVEGIAPDAVLSTPCDILAPCALGGVVNDETLPHLKCQIIGGSANNVLDEPRHGEGLHEAGILYLPDYYVNAGGLVFLEEEMLGHSEERTLRRVRAVGGLVGRVITRAKEDGLPASVVADRMAEERLRALGAVGPGYVSGGGSLR